MGKVELKNANKIYDNDVHVIQDLNLEIKDKEFMVFVGPSGCGKSTLLRMIAGLEDISGGEIAIDERVVNDVAPKDRDIAMVFQNYALYPHMSVFDNLAFGLKLRKFEKEEIESRVQEAAEILGLKEFLHRKPRQLSGGQRQRVAVGRAIVRHPKVFLFDEPLSNLDAKLRVQMRAEISKLHHRLDTTMIYVTHDQTEAMTMGDRITVLRDGFVQQVDTPLHLYDHPNNVFVAGFIGSPAMNFIQGQLTGENGMTFKTENVNVPVPKKYQTDLKDYVGKNVIFGVRPEHIDVAPSDNKSMIKAIVSVIEPMGNEIIINMETGKDNLVARLVTRDVPKISEVLHLVLDEDHFHFFDAETEKNLVTLN